MQSKKPYKYIKTERGGRFQGTCFINTHHGGAQVTMSSSGILIRQRSADYMVEEEKIWQKLVRKTSINGSELVTMQL